MLELIERGQVFNSGATSISLTINPRGGNIVGRRMWYTSPGTGSIIVYRPRTKMLANAAVSADTTLVVKTDASGYVEGAVISTNDKVLVQNPTTGAWVLAAVSSVAAVSSSTVSLGLGTAVTCSAAQVVYLVRAADIVTLVTGTETKTDLDYWFIGMGREMPVHIVMAATGTNYLATTFDVER